MPSRSLFISLLVMMILIGGMLNLITHMQGASDLITAQQPYVQAQAYPTARLALTEAMENTLASIRNAQFAALCSIALTIIIMGVSLFVAKKEGQAHDVELYNDLKVLLEDPTLKATLPNVQPGSNREIVNQILVRYKDKVADMNDVVQHLKSAVNVLMEDGTTLPQGSKEVYTQLDKLMKYAEYTLNSANIASKLSEEAMQQSNTSHTTLKDSCASINAMAAELKESLQNLSRIATESTKVQKSITAMRSTLEEINLLSINAGIEAARSGNAGRGLANIAQDVAAQSKSILGAGKEISDWISNLQSSVEAVSIGLQDKVTNYVYSDSPVNHSIEMLEGVAQNIEQIYKLSRAIMEAAEAQSQAATKISHGLSTTYSANGSSLPTTGSSNPLKQLHGMLSGMNV